jgi:hypothetical protein
VSPLHSNEAVVGGCNTVILTRFTLMLLFTMVDIAIVRALHGSTPLGMRL